MYTVQCIPIICYSLLYNYEEDAMGIQYIIYTIQCTVYIVHNTVYNVECIASTMHIVHCIYVYSYSHVHNSNNSYVHCTLYTVHCTIVYMCCYCILNTVHCTVYSVQQQHIYTIAMYNMHNDG